jgi:hemoglobin/transferrin/lactoferrin receptor protein
MKGIMLLCLLFGYGYGIAQNPQQADTTRILSEVVISVNRWEQTLREVPNRVTKVNSALTQFQNPQTAADLLGASNQVFIQKSQMGGGSPMIRGFAANRVLLVVDGVRMNTAIFRSGNVQNVISLDANAIESAEVIFGPGAVLYGSDAIGGVLEFHTLQPKFSTNSKPRINANTLVRYSSANQEKTGHVDFSIGLEKWAFLSSITFAAYDDLKQGSFGPDEYLRKEYVALENGVEVVKQNADARVQVPTGYSQFNTLQKIRFRPSVNWDVQYAFHYAKIFEYDRYDRLILKNESNDFVHAEWYYGPQQWVMHALHANYMSPTKLFDYAQFTMAYQEQEESRHNRNLGSANLNNRFEKVRVFSATLDLDKKLSDKLHLYYGGEAVFNTVSSTAFRENFSTATRSPLSTRYPDGAVWRSYAAYANLKIRLNEAWLITGSGRLSNIYTHADFTKEFFDFPFTETTLTNTGLNGSVGIIYSPVDTWKLFTNASTGFRAPNVDDIGKIFDSQPGNVVVPNPDLIPEKAYSLEVGWVADIHQKLTLDLGMYYTRMSNAIARAPSTFNGQDSIYFDEILSRVLSLQNINTVYVYGAQAGIDWKIKKYLALTSNLNYQKGKEKDVPTGINYSPTHVAPLFGSTHIVYTGKKIKADLYANYNGTIAYKDLAFSERGDAHLYSKDDQGNPFSPSWWTANFKSSLKASNTISIDFGIENIMDKRYRPYSSGISAPGRNFIVSLRGKI